MTFNGTVSDINAALNGLTFLPARNSMARNADNHDNDLATAVWAAR
jgi:hypothetical protein